MLIGLTLSLTISGSLVSISHKGWKDQEMMDAAGVCEWKIDIGCKGGFTILPPYTYRHRVGSL